MRSTFAAVVFTLATTVQAGQEPRISLTSQAVPMKALLPILAVKTGQPFVSSPPTDLDYGSRDYGARDPEGNRWSFGTYTPG